LVSNEVGSGIVPLGELSRRFVDEAGWLNQALAAKADRVTLVVAGLPLALKPVSSDSSGALGLSVSGTSPDQRGKV
jgi:adenosylcobinamide kinase/adenosylcobinamide-phosphate guanylyltransferase